MPLDLDRLKNLGGPGSNDLREFLRDLAVATQDLQTKFNAHTHSALDTGVIAGQQSDEPVPTTEN